MRRGYRNLLFCQCGYYGDELHDCTCTQPLISDVWRLCLDRIDPHIQVFAVKYKEPTQDEKLGESSMIRERTLRCRNKLSAESEKQI